MVVLANRIKAWMTWCWPQWPEILTRPPLIGRSFINRLPWRSSIWSAFPFANSSIFHISTKYLAWCSPHKRGQDEQVGIGSPGNSAWLCRPASGLDRHWYILLLILTPSLFWTMIDKSGSRSNRVEATLLRETWGHRHVVSQGPGHPALPDAEFVPNPTKDVDRQYILWSLLRTKMSATTSNPSSAALWILIRLSYWASAPIISRPHSIWILLPTPQGIDIAQNGNIELCFEKQYRF